MARSRARGRRKKLAAALRFDLTLRGDLAEIRRQAEAQRRPVPPQFAEPPEVRSDLRLYYDAFCDLTNERSFGYGVGPIPMSAMRTYCLDNEIVGEQRDLLYYLVSVMDREYIKWWVEESNRKAKAKRK